MIMVHELDLESRSLELDQRLLFLLSSGVMGLQILPSPTPKQWLYRSAIEFIQ